MSTCLHDIVSASTRHFQSFISSTGSQEKGIQSVRHRVVGQADSELDLCISHLSPLFTTDLRQALVISPPEKTMSNESRDAAIREAKRFVREVVRNDWEFEPTASSDNVRPKSSSSACSTGTLPQNREVVEWRCREFDSSGSELEPQCSDQDDEDSPSAATTDPGIERRRRRRRQMDEEMAWNEGLRMWMARRDAWSGARTRRQIRAKEEKAKLEGSSNLGNDQSVPDGVDSADGSNAGCPRTESQDSAEASEAANLANRTDASLSITEKEKLEELHRRQDQEEEQSTPPDDEKRKESTETSITEPDQQVSTKAPSNSAISAAIEDSDEEDEARDSEEEEEELDEPLIPVAPPFISSENPIRATINQAIYPSIYTKVVVQGMTPTVPVNLADLTRAMVQGWKADGQWPPKPAVSSIVLQDDATVPKTDTDRSPTQSRRKNSITNAMRKVFHLGAHPFHRRGSSSHDGNAGSATGAAGHA